MFQDTSDAVIEEIKDPRIYDAQVRLFIKREDRLHSQVSGNKWRKLKFNIAEARTKNFNQLLTFGGAFSNHILATAAAANVNGLKSVGIIRGEEADFHNPTLSKAITLGMSLKKVSRSVYKDKTQASFLKALENEFGPFFHIPEGGSNALAVEGVMEMMDEIPKDTDYVVSAVGTGATLAGIIKGARSNQQVIGIPVLKGAMGLERDISFYIDKEKREKWKLIDGYHFNGYAKFNHDLIQFINEFKRITNIPLDPIYTGKMMFGVYDLIFQGFFPKGSKIVTIHTGGLQGIDGFNERFDEIILL